MPDSVLEQVKAANEAWIEDAVARPLVHPSTGARIFLAPTCCWAPLQWEVIRAVMDRARPQVVAMEQPPLPLTRDDASSGSTAAHQQQQQQEGDSVPDWIPAFLEHFDAVVCEENLSPALASRPPPAAAVAALRARLEAPGPHRGARVGRDLLDPDEHYGLYAHNELARGPERILDAWQLLEGGGWLPGMEHVAAAQLAAQAGARLAAVDAPLQLQERWVEALVADFFRRQRDGGPHPLPFELIRDSHMLRSRLPPGQEEWDARLGDAFAELGPPALLAFKLSRATAAATLAPGDLPAVATRLRRLQPLKWAHVARREGHMAWRLRELCEGGAGAKGGAAAAAGKAAETAATAAAAAAKGQAPGGSSSGGGGGGSGGVQSVVLVCGRQHVPGLRALWGDAGSPLWRDSMPREFAPSVVDDYAARAAAAAEVAGSGAGAKAGP